MAVTGVKFGGCGISLEKAAKTIISAIIQYFLFIYSLHSIYIKVSKGFKTFKSFGDTCVSDAKAKRLLP